MIKLLVVDDSALMRKLLGGIFGAEPDVEIAFARNGREALALLPEFAPDVVTLDVHMPEMDGLACLDRIMVERPCPVVMVSSLTAQGAAITLEALELGAVDFVPKPSGAISLGIGSLAPMIVQKVRLAASTPVRKSLRLRERVRMKAGVGPLPDKREEQLPRERPLRAATRSGAPGLVLVGCSTGGPPALDAVLTRLPADFPWPVLVAQHMPASFTGALAQRLDRLCALSVVEVVRPLRLEPGTVYIAKGDADVIVSTRSDGPIAMAAPPHEEYLWHPSVERMVASAMDRIEPARLVGILMTGMGRDGASAMTRLHRAGGRTIAESEESAVVWGMPGELVKAGGAEFVEPVAAIAECLIELVT